jgi:hypothetical protein
MSSTPPHSTERTGTPTETTPKTHHDPNWNLRWTAMGAIASVFGAIGALPAIAELFGVHPDSIVSWITLVVGATLFGSGLGGLVAAVLRPKRHVQGRILVAVCLLVAGTLLATNGYRDDVVPIAGPGLTLPGGSAGTSGVRWHNSMTIGTKGVQLDALPPTSDGITASLYFDAGPFHPVWLETTEGTIYAIWNNSSQPTRDQCYDWLQNHVTLATSISPTRGLDLCVRTGQGRTAYMTVTSVSRDSLTADVIVWNG